MSTGHLLFLQFARRGFSASNFTGSGEQVALSRLLCIILYFYYSRIRADVSARTALHTGVKNLIVPFIFHDRLCWADLPAGSAHKAVIRYEVSHQYFLFSLVLGRQTGLNVFVIF